MIDEKNFFNQPVENDLMTYVNIWKIGNGQEDDSTTGCLLDYDYFENYFRMIAIDLIKQQEVDSDPKAIQQINFTGNLERYGQTKILFIIEEARETILDFSQGIVEVLSIYFTLI